MPTEPDVAILENKATDVLTPLWMRAFDVGLLDLKVTVYEENPYATSWSIFRGQDLVASGRAGAVDAGFRAAIGGLATLLTWQERASAHVRIRGELYCLSIGSDGDCWAWLGTAEGRLGQGKTDTKEAARAGAEAWLTRASRPTRTTDDQHLDLCQRCRDPRLGLCPTGARLMDAARVAFAERIKPDGEPVLTQGGQHAD